MIKKIQSGVFPTVLCGLFSTIMLPGCVGNGATGKSGMSVDSILTDTTVFLDQANAGSPQCKIKISFKYFQPSGTDDSLAQAVNSVLENTFSSAHAGAVSPGRFVSSIKESLANDYLKDVQESYQTDVKNGMKADEIPNWYNYEYTISSELKEGKDSIWNYAVTTFQYTGGAHPNTWARWINVNIANGKTLGKEDVFVKGSEEKISRLLLPYLLQEANKKLETDTLTCMEGLQSAGILLDTDLYVPENFLLEKNGVTFLYNTYDIAPYYMGCFRLTVPYQEINTYLIKN